MPTSFRALKLEISRGKCAACGAHQLPPPAAALPPPSVSCHSQNTEVKLRQGRQAGGSSDWYAVLLTCRHQRSEAAQKAGRGGAAVSPRLHYKLHKQPAPGASRPHEQPHEQLHEHPRLPPQRSAQHRLSV